MSKAKPGTHTVNRSSITGRFVTPQYAQTHKRTTETQHVRNPAPSSPKRSK